MASTLSYKPIHWQEMEISFNTDPSRTAAATVLRPQRLSEHPHIQRMLAEKGKEQDPSWFIIIMSGREYM